MEVTDLERRFVEAARLHGLHRNEGDPGPTNAAYDKAIAAVRALQTLPDRGHRFLRACLEHPDPSVVLWAAFYLLPHSEAAALDALERVSRGVDRVAFDAETALREWRAGRLRVE
jgi:hypothetical protein